MEIDGVYGEVKLIGVRAVHLLTADDNEVIIPHYRFWSKPVSNATSGGHTVLCVVDFYLHPDHDAQAVIACLEEVAMQSALRKLDSKLVVVAREKPWATHYKIKAYVRESREQFAFMTELTIRGKAALRAQGLEFAYAKSYAIPAGK